AFERGLPDGRHHLDPMPAQDLDGLPLDVVGRGRLLFSGRLLLGAGHGSDLLVAEERLPAGGQAGVAGDPRFPGVVVGVGRFALGEVAVQGVEEAAVGLAASADALRVFVAAIDTARRSEHDSLQVHRSYLTTVVFTTWQPPCSTTWRTRS